MSGKEREQLLDAMIESGINRTPGERVPVDFSARVMAGLEPKKPTAWTRFRLWLTGPKAITFTPLQTVPAVACVVALLIIGVVKMSGPITESGPNMTTVRFVMNDSAHTAQSVSVIGSFNDWQAQRSVMWYDEETGAWVLEAKLQPGDHEYMFLVDGSRLVPDPQAAMTRDDGFGNSNSILFVNGSHEQSL